MSKPPSSSPALFDSPLRRWLSAVYRAALWLRNAAYDHRLLPSRAGVLPSICVGNVVLGGSGKTPFTQWLAEGLLERGFRPAVLLRGYRGSVSAPCLVHAGMDPKLVGDEAVLHRELLPSTIPVVVSPDRLAGIEFLTRETRSSVVVLDDGLQHRRLRPEFSILLLNSSSAQSRTRWEKGRVVPAGFLREPLAAAIRRADCLVQTSRTTATTLPVPSAISGTLPQFQFRFSAECFIDVFNNERVPLSHFAKRTCDAATAVAEPQAFFTLLQDIGIQVTTKRAFPDHHHFTAEELAEMLSGSGEYLLVTEKDAVKIRGALQSPGQVFALRSSGSFLEASSETLFWELLLSAVATPPQTRSSKGIRQ